MDHSDSDHLGSPHIGDRSGLTDGNRYSGAVTVASLCTGQTKRIVCGCGIVVTSLSLRLDGTLKGFCAGTVCESQQRDNPA